MTREIVRKPMLVLTALVLAWGGGSAWSDDKFVPPKELVDAGNTTCAVLSGKPVTETGGVALFEGKIYHFCCNNCPKAFEKDPKKFVANVTGTESKLAVDQSGKDPVNGNPATEKFVRVHKGTAYFFSDEDSVAAFDKEPDKYVKTPTTK